MKTTNLLWTICISLGVAVAAVAATLVGVFEENRNLRQEIRIAQADAQRVADELQGLEAEKGDLTAELSDKRDELQKAQSELADAKETQSRTNEVAASSATPRPVKVRTYLGNQYLGMSWLIPSGVSRNPKSGAVTYEPVLVLDESLKQNLVTYKTNVIEREVAATVNYNYPWTYYYPVPVLIGGHRATNCNVRPMPGTLPPKSRQPQDPQLFLNTRFQPPTDKPFLPLLPQTQSVPPQNRLILSGALQPRTAGVTDPGNRPLAVWVPPK